MNILVTGASKGFGKLIAETLLSNGHQVAASMRNKSTSNKGVAEALAQKGATVVELDVTSTESVNRAVAECIQSMGQIDAVVNNAGVGVHGIQETFTPEDMQKLFDINVFGVQRVNRAVLPEMRKRQSGLLIHISSLLGRMTLPFYGPYNASKWALEALAENYRIELSGYGIDCCIVEPGGFATAFPENLIHASDQDRLNQFGEFGKVPEQSLTHFLKTLEAHPEQNPQLVADAVLSLVKTANGQRPFRTTVDKLGMGDPVAKYNDHLETVMQTIYSNFGMANMLSRNASGTTV